MTHDDDDRFAFHSGSRYALRVVRNPKEYLDSALRGERYIARYQRHSEDGLYWTDPGRGQSVGLSWYSGVAGLSSLYAQLYRATGEDRFADIASESARYLTRHWKEVLTAAQPWLTDDLVELYNCGYQFGAAGVGVVLLDLYREFGEESYRRTVEDIVHYYLDAAKPGEHGGVHWTNTGIAFDGGVILFLIEAYLAFGGDDVRRVIVSAAREYLARGHRTVDGGLLYHGFEGHLDYSYPNFTYGPAGSGLVLARLYQFLEDDQYLQGAKDAAAYVEHVAVRQTQGYLIPQRVGEGQPTILCLNVCSGPGGTARLFSLLYDITGDTHYADQVVELVDGMESLGAPETQSAGLWNNLCLCCGHAGLIQFFIGLYLHDGNERWRDLAERSAAVVLGGEERLDDGASDWPEAWERVRPENITRPIGYFDGVGGIVATLLQMYQWNAGHLQVNRHLEDPFPKTLPARCRAVPDSRISAI